MAQTGWVFTGNAVLVLTRVGQVILALLVAASMPLLVWAAAGVAFYQLYAKWRKRRLVATLACSIHTDCPPGYLCLNGRCMQLACAIDTDCPPGTTCVNGMCVPAY